MRGVYVATAEIASLAAAKTLMYITAPAAAAVEILSIRLTNQSNETNEQLEVTLKRVSSLGTPTATSVTPTKCEAGDQSAGSTVKANVTSSEPTYSDVIGRWGISSLAGLDDAPIPEARRWIAPGATAGLYMESTPSSFDAGVEIVFREVG